MIEKSKKIEKWIIHMSPVSLVDQTHGLRAAEGNQPIASRDKGLILIHVDQSKKEFLHGQFRISLEILEHPNLKLLVHTVASTLNLVSSEKSTEARLDMVMRIHSIIITIVLSPAILERIETIGNLGWSVLVRERSLERRKEGDNRKMRQLLRKQLEKHRVT